MAARTLSRLATPRACLAAVLLVYAAVGCESEQDRLDHHLRRADEALLLPNGRATRAIELENALQLRPDSAEINYLLGRTRQEQGLIRDAIFFYEEAVYLDPEPSRTAVALALLIRGSDGERAHRLVRDALGRDPENPWVHAALAELARDRESPIEAIEAATRSVELDPEFSFGYWVLGSAHLAQIRVAQILDERADDEHFIGADAAFKRYGELVGPSDQWNSLLERARVLAARPGYAKESLEMFRAAMADADEHAQPEGKLRAASHLLEFARARQEDELREAALVRLLELEPEHLAYWDELARLRELATGGGGETLARLIEEQPGRAEAHLRYAGYLQATQGSTAATEHLLKFVDNEDLRPTLLGALVEMYEANGELAKRDDMLRQLEDEYPFHPITKLSRALLAFKAGFAESAAQDLRDLVERGDGPKTQRLLAYAEFALGNYREALDAATSAVEANPRFASELLELRAQAAYALGDCSIAGRAMLQLLSEDRLEARQQVRLARCFYKSDRREYGRKLLRKLLSRPAPPHEAVLEFARREMDEPEQRSLLRSGLTDALRRRPDDPTLLLYLADARRRDGEAREALDGLDSALARHAIPLTAPLLFLRAQLHSDLGDLESAERDARDALQLDPALPGGLKFHVSTLASLERYEAAIALLEERERSGRLSANRTAVLARLYLRAGRPREGRQAMLLAYQKGSRLPDVLNTLAVWLADDEESRPHALALARQAAERPNAGPASLHALGYVYLRQGDAETALRYFERAVEAADAADSQEPQHTRATYHFRRGLALRALGRTADASSAFERAHSLDPARPLSPPAPPSAGSSPGSHQTAGARS